MQARAAAPVGSSIDPPVHARGVPPARGTGAAGGKGSEAGTGTGGGALAYLQDVQALPSRKKNAKKAKKIGLCTEASRYASVREAGARLGFRDMSVGQDWSLYWVSTHHRTPSLLQRKHVAQVHSYV